MPQTKYVNANTFKIKAISNFPENQSLRVPLFPYLLQLGMA